MAAEGEEAVPAGGPDEIRPYKIHVSSKYLDLTKQKLEVTRLPHELSEPKSKDWWEPKPRVEPLIDFWLEQYSWRTQQDQLNAELPQYRTGFSIPSSESIVRIHFIHARSSHSNAIPLLLIPPFPFSNLSFGHLIKLFAEPEDAANTQPFHLIIPSLPGVGFSDALPNNTPVISSTADILNSLMGRLSYPCYLVTNAGSGAASPAEIDFKLANYLATNYSSSCLGAHFISPPLAQPKLREAPVEWVKWSIASLFHAPILGYLKDDFSALERSGYVRPSKKAPTPAQFGLNQLGLREPNSLAYALCDSPTGLLVFVLKSLRLLGPKQEFTPTEVINFTQLAWLPGPESAMRFWAHCVRHPEEVEKKGSSRPRIGLTVFLGDEPSTGSGTVPEAEAEAEAGAEANDLGQEEAKDRYTCPSWANVRYNVVYTNRVTGKSGLLAWERPDVVAAGIRGVVTSILKWDSRLRSTPEPATAPLEQVVVQSESAASEQPAPTPAEPAPALLVPPSTDEPGHPHPHREVSDETAVGSNENVAGKSPSPLPKTPSPAHLAPPTDERAHPRREASDDTAVETAA
ncbi:alpha/beta-hydrolase [Hypoxylon trugodes]|uniref:alpha/beta-hydrolase n=1 Tax=Hypoxylon trugodes TaxID=326681 RepID=UPI0021A2380F|nr:alpha/beta-hydrolase [Hypoxylon trugodes]KAI1391206.1 alpha/beta-hydrolase [Hypoxylon trugodes]